MPLPKEHTCTIKDIYSLPEGTRAELMEGQIFFMAPPSRRHQELVHFLDRIIGNHIVDHQGNCKIYPAPFAVFLTKDDKTYLEPDITIVCDAGKLDEKGCKGAPDWIIEIVSPGNSSHDYLRKLNLYADAGVREYWIVNPMKQTVLVYHLEETSFELNTYTFQDKIKVNIYDDLWIDFQEITL